MGMIEASLLCLGPHGFHRVAYTEWGDPSNRRILVCVHGLTRQGRDFDALATALGGTYRVACPDVAGRGRSDWLLHREDYGYPLYLADMASLIARLGVDEVDWVGTSMGGLIGLMLAAQPNSPIRRLVLNDVGPFVPKAALARLAAYVGADPRFASLAEAEAYLRRVHAPFGPLDDAQWRHMAEHSVRRGPGGGFALHYDPAIAEPFLRDDLQDVDLWPLWNAVRCPVLVVRGSESDLLLPETAQRMLTEGPEAELVEIPGVGHAPALMSDEQIGYVRQWLLG
jgi:pimeloyl-ACP methyl ester carboxylesterase